MNTNLIHNILNLIGLLVAALVGFDWAGLGLPPETVALITSVVLFADKILKFMINIWRDGISGLVKDQPPVVK